MKKFCRLAHHAWPAQNQVPDDVIIVKIYWTVTLQAFDLQRVAVPLWKEEYIGTRLVKWRPKPPTPWTQSQILRVSKVKAVFLRPMLLWKFNTLRQSHSRSITRLWYDIGLFWASLICLKSAAKQFFSFYSNRYSLYLSKEVLIVPKYWLAPNL